MCINFKGRKNENQIKVKVFQFLYVESSFFFFKSLNQPQFTPQEGKLVNDIEKAWQGLENAEHNREVALREELLRQEKLEQLNYKFEKKVSLPNS